MQYYYYTAYREGSSGTTIKESGRVLAGNESEARERARSEVGRSDCVIVVEKSADSRVFHDDLPEWLQQLYDGR